MSIFQCPKCEVDFDISDYPDHLADLRNNRFTFECDACEIEFECAVDWSPDITVLDDGVSTRKPVAAAPLSPEQP